MVPLTRADVAHLREAASVSFHHYDGEHIIRADVERHARGNRIAERRQFPVSGNIIDYERAERTRGLDYYRCFTLLQGARHSATWQTVTAHLRVGDTLSLRWIASNNTESLRRVEYHHDSLHLLVGRRGRDDTYHVDDSVGPDNSARMIRYDEHGTAVPRSTYAPTGPILEEAGRLLRGRRYRQVNLCVSPLIAENLSATTQLGDVTATVITDDARLDDELIITDNSWKQLIGMSFAPSSAVLCNGSNAVTLYRLLRSEGHLPSEASAVALAATN